jgi:hypothetical protein
MRLEYDFRGSRNNLNFKAVVSSVLAKYGSLFVVKLYELVSNDLEMASFTALVDLNFD